MQPATRWAFPPPFENRTECARRSAQAAARRLAARRSLPGSGDHAPLLALLIADLCQGHFHVAVRHFLMLRACGAKLPALIERSCEELLQACPVGRRTKITRDVENWLAMVRDNARRSRMH